MQSASKSGGHSSCHVAYASHGGQAVTADGPTSLEIHRRVHLQHPLESPAEELSRPAHEYLVNAERELPNKWEIIQETGVSSVEEKDRSVSCRVSWRDGEYARHLANVFLYVRTYVCTCNPWGADASLSVLSSVEIWNVTPVTRRTREILRWRRQLCPSSLQLKTITPCNVKLSSIPLTPDSSRSLLSLSLSTRPLLVARRSTAYETERHV